MKTVEKKSYKKLMSEYHAEIGRLARLAWESYMRDVCQNLYIVGTKSDCGTYWKSLDIAPDHADGIEIVSQERLRKDFTIDQIAWQVQKIIGREPLWIFAES